MKVQADINKRSLERFAYWILVYEFIVVFLYAYFVRYDNKVAEPHVQEYYPWFQDINVMMLIGFGYLMAFIRTNSWSAVGLTFLINAVVVQCYVIFRGFWHRVFTNFSQPYIYLNIVNLAFGSYAVAGMLIAFGALIGRILPSQILFMSVFGCFFYSLSETLVYDKLQVVDVGGSITIHTFGAYFGLALSFVLGKTHSLQGINTTVNYHSNMFSMLGTLFLWMFWPSFNSGAIDWNTANLQSIRLWTIINTVLSLTGSCLGTFVMSKFFRGKLHMEDVLNATLAGGVAIGACCSLMQNPVGAIVIGLVAGLISSAGFGRIGPWLSKKGLIDVCGVHNLHAMPGFLGGIASAIVFGIYTVSGPSIIVNPSTGLDYTKQAGMQIAGTFISLGIALISGAFCGFVLSYMQNIPAFEFFEDKVIFDTHIPEPNMRKAKSYEVPRNKTNLMENSMIELNQFNSSGNLNITDINIGNAAPTETNIQ